MTRGLILSILGVLCASLLPLPAQAAAETFHFSSRGEFADASFLSIDSSGCIETAVFVGVVDRLVKEGGGPNQPESWAQVLLLQRDVCAGALLLAAAGREVLAPEQFQIDKLDSATLNASITVIDNVSGSSFAVDVALAWQATDEPLRFKEHTLVHEPTRMVNTRVACTGALCLGRGSAVTGTISDGTTNFSPETGTGVLGSAKTGQVVVERG